MRDSPGSGQSARPSELRPSDGLWRAYLTYPPPRLRGRLRGCSATRRQFELDIFAAKRAFAVEVAEAIGGAAAPLMTYIALAPFLGAAEACAVAREG